MIQNKRDLGGLKTKEGIVIPRGKLIRSAFLVEADEADLEGISTIIDLRTTKEAEEKPDLSFGKTYLHLPVFDAPLPGITRERDAEGKYLPDMNKIYAAIVRSCKDSFRNILLTIMEHDYLSGAILWHCSEGKDRCGLISALILEMLDVSRKLIMEDYLKTNLVNLEKANRIREEVQKEKGDYVADKMYRAVIADEDYLKSAWDAMGQNYIREDLGISSLQIQKFREKIF